MPRAGYMPQLEGHTGIGDAANPLVRIQPQSRHIRFLEGPPLDETQRNRMLSRHCAKRGRKHDWLIQHRDGIACLWCGLVRVEP